jgi:cell division protein FtsB
MISNRLAARRSQAVVPRLDFRICVFIMLAPAAAAPAIAQDAARVSRLESEIQQLRAQLDEQNRRIQRLEAELARLAGPKSAAPAPPPKLVAPENRARGPTASGPQPWHASAAWDRVQKGMTAEQAVAVLGEPRAVESVDGFKTLFYRGTTASGASLDGIVNLRDDRVVAVVKPEF